MRRTWKMMSAGMSVSGRAVAWVLAALVFCLPGPVRPHGRLLMPPSRSSVWRLAEFSFAPPNYDDNGLNCGGFYQQWHVNNGSCGICGDPWDGPRNNEAGGKYANPALITREYSEGGTVDVTVEITANHLGWFEFRLCPLQPGQDDATHQCLNRHLLQLSPGSSSRYYIGGTTGIIKLVVQLPQHLTCDHCVLQWKYHAGNSWGTDKDTGRNCVGCGPQEEFYGCADIRILAGSSSQTHPADTETTSVTTRPSPTETKAPTVPTRPSQAMPSRCRAAGAYVSVPGMDAWCQTNCAVNNCPSTHCTCEQTNPANQCSGYKFVNGDHVQQHLWCNAECFTGSCPRGCACADNDPSVPSCPVKNAYQSSSVHLLYCSSACLLDNCDNQYCICP